MQKRRKSSAKSKSYNLLVVAHPDDEAIFFSGLLQRRRSRPWLVICATDANADGQGQLRHRQFQKSMKTLGIQDHQWWGYPDIFAQRLPVTKLIERLELLPQPSEIFTHSIIGEYMHPHHQDVSYSVHQAFAKHRKIYVPAYNAYPEFSIALSPTEFRTKQYLLTEVYGSETTRFLNLLPATHCEGYLRLGANEANEVYGFLAKRHKLAKRKLHDYAWMYEFLRSRPMKKRPF